MNSSSSTIIHRVTSVRIDRIFYPREEMGSPFHNLRLTVTDESGGTFEIALFSEAQVEIEQ